jgi:hypothetical protein
MRKKTKATPKVKPISQRKVSTNKLVYEPPSETFDVVFPLTLKFMEGKEEKVCYFQCQEHLDKYLIRSGLKPKEYKVSKTVPKIKDILDFLNEK